MKSTSLLLLLITGAILAVASEASWGCLAQVGPPWSTACTRANCAAQCQQNKPPCDPGTQCYIKSRCTVQGCECSNCIINPPSSSLSQQQQQQQRKMMEQAAQ